MPFIVSYFHAKIGPDIAITEPEDLEETSQEDIMRVMKQMDGASPGFFTMTVGSLSAVNYYFTINSPWARGGFEMVMISGLVQEKEPDLRLYEQEFQNFERVLKEDPDIYQAFYFRDSDAPRAKISSIQDKLASLRVQLAKVARVFKLMSNTHATLLPWDRVRQEQKVELPGKTISDFEEIASNSAPNCFFVFRRAADAIKIDLLPVQADVILKVSVIFQGALTPEMINELLGTFATLHVKAIFTSGLCVEEGQCVYEVYVDPQGMPPEDALVTSIIAIAGVKDVRITPVELAAGGSL